MNTRIPRKRPVKMETNRKEKQNKQSMHLDINSECIKTNCIDIYFVSKTKCSTRQISRNQSLAFHSAV